MNFLDAFSKNTRILNFIKIQPVEKELFSADGPAGGQIEDRQADRHDKAYSDVSQL
jgi:hypothetical protein